MKSIQIESTFSAFGRIGERLSSAHPKHRHKQIPNTTNNFFNSSIYTGGNARNPNLKNNTGLDISMFTLNNDDKVILIHNHPSGSVKPSRQDLLMTRRMKEAGELIGIFVKDHIIIGGRTGESYSFREHELIKPFSDTKIAAEEKNVKEETAEYIIPKKKKSKQRGR